MSLSGEDGKLADEMAKVARRLKREESRNKRNAKLQSAALRWLIVPLYLWLGLWIPLADAPPWGQALGIGVGVLIVYVIYTIEKLKEQFNAIGEMTWQNWRRAGGVFREDD